MKKCFLVVIISFMTFFILFFSQTHFMVTENKEIDFGTEIALTVNGTNTTTFPKKESNLKIKNISCNEGVGYWDYKAWSLRIRNVKNTKIKCNIDFVNEYHENILNGTDPVLGSGLIPVTIEADGTVKRAKLGSEWYSYEKKEWANAVILESDSKTYYEGEVIPIENIESYFVWIPRFKYKIFNDGKYSELTIVVNKVQQIEVIFENKNTAVSNGSTVGSYLSHPAFTSFNNNGMWIGKFETGYKGAKNTIEAQANTNDSSKVQIKPNVYSWRGIQPANIHLNSYNYQRSLDSHMMKNTEWGAVAYLQHSNYGSKQSVRINNHSSYLTGYSAVSEPTCGYTGANESCNKYGSSNDVTQSYNTATGYLASTTGNVSGIYDMSGGAYEYVMGDLVDKNGNPMSGRGVLGNSGFNGSFGCVSCDGDTSGKTELTTGINFPDSKYYDKYAYAENNNDYQRRILGDATGEMGPFQTVSYGSQSKLIGSWYKDESSFVISWASWFARGNHYDNGMNSGINAFVFSSGDGHANTSFRIVLSL